MFKRKITKLYGQISNKGMELNAHYFDGDIVQLKQNINFIHSIIYRINNIRNIRRCRSFQIGRLDGMASAYSTVLYTQKQKAMAKEPIYNIEEYGNTLPHCPWCEKTLPRRSVYGDANFCHICGQAIKWR